jgi:hypothetical protein
MPINFNEYGFAWPNASTVKNYSGQEMAIKLEYVRSNYQDNMGERQKECYRLYDTPLGFLSEFEIKYWQLGGEDPGGEDPGGEDIGADLINAYQEVFKENGKPELPIAAVLESLEKRKFDVIQIHVVVGWLIKGHYVSFDPEKMLVGDINRPLKNG